MKKKVLLPTESRTIRISRRDFDYFMRESNYKSINRGVEITSRMMQTLEAQGLASIAGMFTEGEWKYMAIILRYAPLIEEQRLDKGLLNQAIRTAYSKEQLLEKYDCDLERLTIKVLGLSRLECLALCNRIRDFWLSNPNWSTDSNYNIGLLNVWSKY